MIFVLKKIISPFFIINGGRGQPCKLMRQDLPRHARGRHGFWGFFGLHFQFPDETENTKFASRRGKAQWNERNAGFVFSFGFEMVI